MTKYTEKSFTVAVGSDDYRDNYEKVFGKKERKQAAAPEPRWELCPTCGRGHFCTPGSKPERSEE